VLQNKKSLILCEILSTQHGKTIQGQVLYSQPPLAEMSSVVVRYCWTELSRTARMDIN